MVSRNSDDIEPMAESNGKKKDNSASRMNSSGKPSSGRRVFIVRSKDEEDLIMKMKMSSSGRRNNGYSRGMNNKSMRKTSGRNCATFSDDAWNNSDGSSNGRRQQHDRQNNQQEHQQRQQHSQHTSQRKLTKNETQDSSKIECQNQYSCDTSTVPQHLGNNARPKKKSSHRHVNAKGGRLQVMIYSNVKSGNSDITNNLNCDHQFNVSENKQQQIHGGSSARQEIGKPAKDSDAAPTKSCNDSMVREHNKSHGRKNCRRADNVSNVKEKGNALVESQEKANEHCKNGTSEDKSLSVSAQTTNLLLNIDSDNTSKWSRVVVEKLFTKYIYWFYIDPSNTLQGGFSSTQMMKWYDRGYLHDPTLPLYGSNKESTPIRGGFREFRIHIFSVTESNKNVDSES